MFRPSFEVFTRKIVNRLRVAMKISPRRPGFLSGLSIVIVVMAMTISVRAEEPPTGRLPDGRAYRTDDQGNQLIDYIAELEVSNQSLEERLRGLEGELKEKTIQLQQLRESGSPQRGLRESDLMKAKNTETTSKVVAAESPCTPQSTPQSTAQATPQCARDLTALRRTLEDERRQSEQSIADYDATIKELRTRLAAPQCPKADCSEAIAPVNARVEALSQELATTLASRDQERERAVKQINDLESELQSTRGALVRANAKIAEFAERASPGLEEASLNAKPAQPHTESLPRVAPAEEPGIRASLSREEIPGVVRAVRRPGESRSIEPPVLSLSPATQLSSARERAVQSLRGGLLSELNQVRGMVEKRDRRFDQFKRTPRAIAFKPARAVSSKGRGVKEIGEAAKSARAVYELTQLRREMIEIRTLMTDDLALMERIN